ncbi:prolyl oligopeptidase family serine peptidase [Caulobacter sp. UNC358MFTsu5.1]|uniref:S9 family peptidase n=1 Tax=Caulobacter sp. UNC358MFTsu5.1 TaxID=1449049 RepID=UPI0004A72C74|nr:prolyl oligopeptidase family serine peptidase [Caulobacter sp. UNC358MFTsu5.1]
MRLLLRCAALCCAFIALAAQARPFTADDLLKVDRRASLGISPDGRWLVLSVTRGQAYAPRFDYDAVYPYAARRLYRVDLTRPGEATPLLAQDDAAGYTAGAFSPDGRRLLVNRLREHQWEAGVVEIATGQVRWLGVGVDLPLFGRTAQWRSNHQIVAIVAPPQDPHFLLRRGWQRAPFTAAARAVTAVDGGPSVLAIGSGRFLDRGAEGPRKTLARIDVETGAVTPLATGDFLDLELSSSGRFVAAFRSGTDVQPHGNEAIRGGTMARRRDLVVADLDAGRVLPGCGDCMLSPFLMAWAPGSDRLLVYVRRGAASAPAGQLAVITPRRGGLDVESLDQVQAAPESTYEGFEIIQAGWVGEAPAVLGRRSQDPDTAPAAWLRIGKAGVTPLLPAGTTAPSKIVADARGRLLVAGSGTVLRLGAGQAGKLNDAAPLPATPLGDSGRPTLAKLVQGETILVRHGRRLVRLDATGDHDLGPAGEQTILAGPTGVAVSAERDDHGVETIRVQAGGTATDVLTLNPQLAAVTFGQMRPVTHKGPDGETLTSWVVLPPGWRADHPPPLVVLPYPGGPLHSPTSPPTDARPGSPLTNVSAQVLAGHGYAVLYPSLPRGRYPDAPAEGLANQILSVVDAVGAAGLADTRRVALWGHSFGGHAVLAAATQSDRFKAIVCTSGIADLASAWGTYVIQTTPDEGLFFTPRGSYIETGQMRVGGPPWAVPDRYVANSPLFHADKITAPVLLAYGDLDEYSDGQGGEMFAALYRQGKDARLLTFFGEGHVITAPGNVRRLYAEVLGWLDQALGEGRPAEARQAPAP